MNKVLLHHRQVLVEGISIHVVEGRAATKPAVLFVRGWPENWASFEQVMILLGDEAHVVALDLPGIGDSKLAPPSNDKRTIAKYVHGVITQMALEEVTLVGHDVGGQIVYSFLHAYPNHLRAAVMMNIAVPGVDPWEEVERNPYIWHFAFHTVPNLPEELVTGHQAHYFDFFYNVLSAKRDGVSKEARQRYVQAYSRPGALKTGFDWYRTFPQDTKDNLKVKGQAVQTPVLYLRGEKESGDLEVYLKGLREGGLRNVRGGIIAGSGHFAADEAPQEVVASLREFIKLVEGT